MHMGTLGGFVMYVHAYGHPGWVRHVGPCIGMLNRKHLAKKDNCKVKGIREMTI